MLLGRVRPVNNKQEAVSSLFGERGWGARSSSVNKRKGELVIAAVVNQAVGVSVWLTLSVGISRSSL